MARFWACRCVKSSERSVNSAWSVRGCVPGASTPYKRWSKCSMEKVRGEGFCSLFQEIKGGANIRRGGDQRQGGSCSKVLRGNRRPWCVPCRRENNLKSSKFVARITFVPLAWTMREQYWTLRKLGANTAGQCVPKRVMEIHHVPVHDQSATRANDEWWLCSAHLW